MKTQILFLLLLSIMIVNKSSFAQITFQKTYATIGSNVGYAVLQTTDSSYIICGHVEGAFLAEDDFRDIAHNNTISIGNAKILLMKVNSLGDTIWTKIMGGTNFKNFGNSVVQTYDGGFVVTGSTENFGVGMYDVILIKTDADGNINWSRTYGGLLDDGGLSLEQTSDSGFIIGGNTMSYGTSTNDFYLIKTDINGDTLWTKTYGGAGYDVASSVIETHDGGYLISGITDSFGTDSTDILLIKTNSNGDTSWTKTYGGMRNDYCSSVKQTPDSGYIILGGTSSFGAGGFDMYLIKTDNEGNVMWNKTYGGSNNEDGRSIKLTGNGGFTIAGVYSIPGVLSVTGYIISINSVGDTIWTKGYNANGVAGFYDVNLTYDGGYIFSGHELQSPGWFKIYLVKTDSLGNSGCYNGSNLITVGNPATQVSNMPLVISTGSINTSPTVVHTSGLDVGGLCVTGIEVTAIGTLLQIFPNPFYTELSVKETKSQGTIILFDLTGKQILKQKTFDVETKINTEKLLPGFYLLNYIEGNKTLNFKVIKK